MAADSHGGGPQEETIRISPETRERLRDIDEANRQDEELLEVLLDRAERAERSTWPAGDYY